MAFETPKMNREFGVGGRQELVEDSTKTFMAQVYRWMFAGLAVTGGTAVAVASSPSIQQAVLGFYLPLIIAQLLLVLALSFLAPKVSGAVAAMMFIGYAFMTGLTFSVLFLVYQLGSIGSAFFITAGAFGALSVYATVTKRDLSPMRTFLVIGLVGIVLASVVNLFIHSSAVSFVTACAGVLVFGGLTAYDTQKLRQYHEQMGHSDTGSRAITGALMLYLDFINLFLSILRLMGNRR